MLRSVLVRTLQADSSVLSACALGGDRLLVGTADALSVWQCDGEKPAVMLQWHSHARLLHAVAFSCEPSGKEVVLVATGGSTVCLYATTGAAAPPLAELVYAHTADLSTGVDAHLPKLPQPVFSNVINLDKQCSIMAVSIYEGLVHCITVCSDDDTGMSLHIAPNRLESLVSAASGSTVVAESIAIMPGGLPIPCSPTHCCVSVLYSAYGPAGLGVEKSVVCLEVDTASAVLKPGPWCIRNVHPSSALLYATRASDAASNGVVLVSSAGLVLIPASAPYHKQAIHGSMAGPPTCAAALGSQGMKHVLGDRHGGLYLLDLQQRCLAAIRTSSPVAAPSCMQAFIQGRSETAAGLLFLGSQAGSSCFVEVPWDVVRPSCTPSAAPHAQLGQQPGITSPWWEVLPLDVAGIHSLAPMRDGVMIDDPSGCGDARLLLSCGIGASGRLALGRWAANLVPVVSGGPALPGRVRLIPLKESMATRHHRYLLLSFDADASTSVLDVGSTHFRQASIPGLCTDQATLACSPMAGGFLLQVTPQGAYLIKPASGDVVSSWPCTVSMAAVYGQYVALASGPTVHCLHVSGTTGRLQEERELQFQQQVSALALFQLTPSEGSDVQEGGDSPWVAAGQWVSNVVTLQQLSADAPACHLSMHDRQPRSVAACSLGGAQYLFVGTSTGEVMWWEMAATLGYFGAPAALQLQPRLWVRAGTAPVELQVVRPAATTTAPPAAAHTPWRSSSAHAFATPPAQPYLLAKSDQLLVVSAAAASPWGSTFKEGQRLSARRVHGGQHLGTSICPLHTADLPPGALTWVTQLGDLHFGQLDLTPALRWDDIPLSATPALAAYHAASHCAAVACCEAGGGYSLRLVDVGELSQVARLPMAEGHSITALCMASLPCSGGSGEGGAAAPGQDGGAPPPGCKEFLLIASCVEGRQVAASAQPSAAAPKVVEVAAVEVAAVAPQEDGAGMWWRADGGSAWQYAAPAADGVGEPSAPMLQGLLSVFEIKQRGEAGGSSAPPAYDLVLHGTCPLPTVCYSLASVVSDPTAFNPPQPSAQQTPGPAPTPMLVAGCADGLRLYRAYIDDAGVEGLQEVELGLQAAAVAEPLQFATAADTRSKQPSACSEEEGRQASHLSATAAAADLASRRLWHQSMALQLVAKSNSFTEGIPTSLAVVGSTVFSTELFSSVLALEVRPAAAGQLPALVPCSADASGSHVGAALPLSNSHLLVGMWPHGLAFMRRDAESQRLAHDAAKRRFEQELERGRGADGGTDDEEEPAVAAVGRPGMPGQQQAGGPGAKPVFVPGTGDCGDMEVLAACAQPRAAAAICSGRLGVELHVLQQDEGQDFSRAVPAQLPSTSAMEQLAVVVVSANGAVHSLRLLTDEQCQPLLRLQQALQRQEQHAPLPAVLAPSLHAPGWRWSPAEPGQTEPGLAGGNCCDADFLQAGLGSLGTAQQASVALGLPPQLLEEVQQLMEALEGAT